MAPEMLPDPERLIPESQEIQGKDVAGISGRVQESLASLVKSNSVEVQKIQLSEEAKVKL